MENENEPLVVPPESEREKTEEGHTTSEENEIVSVENAETSETAAKISATDNAEDLPKKKGQRDMTEGVIWKQILAFALPILLSNVIQRLYNAVDSIVVGRFVGHEALAAVGSNNSIINVFVSLFLGISVGAGVVVAQYYGAKDEEKLKKSVQTCAFLAIVSGIVLTIGGYFLAEPILKLVHTPENVMALSREYLQIYFVGVLGALIYNMGSGVILAVGDSKRPFLYLLFACCLNIALDVVFVKTLGMGVAVIFVMGVASIITYAVNLLLIKWNVEYIQTIAFILVIAALVQLVEIVIKRFSPGLYNALGVYLPLITTNCAVLGVAIVNVTPSYGYNLIQAFLNGVFSGVGFTLAIVLMAGIREKLRHSDIPESFQGFPITLVAASIMSMAFTAFGGMI